MRSLILIISLHFLSRLRNSTIATKISQSEEFEKFDRYSLKNCIEKALMLESRLQIREMVTIARENLENKDPKVMEMSEEGEEQQEELISSQEIKVQVGSETQNLANLDMLQVRRLWTFMEENVQRQIRPWSNWRIE